MEEPGHCGVKGNKQADRLAGTASRTEGKSMDPAVIFAALRDHTRLEDLHVWQAQSLSELWEMQSKIGIARHVRLYLLLLSHSSR